MRSLESLHDQLPEEAAHRGFLLRKFVSEHVVSCGRAFEDCADIPKDIWDELRALNLWQWTVPANFGGCGMSACEIVATTAVLAYGSAALSTAVAVNLTAGLSIFVAGQPILQERFVEAVISRGELSSFAFTEKQAGSDITNIQTVAHRVTGGYKITGEKCFVTNGSNAEHFVVAARLSDERRTSRGLTLFYVPRGSSGLEIEMPHAKLGQRAVHTNPISLQSVFVPGEHRIGEEGDGLKITSHVLQRSRISLAGGAVGVCFQAGQMAREYLEKRRLLRRSLMSQPVIRGELAQAHTELEAAWQLIRAAAQDWDNHESCSWRANMAKLYAGQVASRFVSRVMELFGGWGYTTSFEIERLLRDVKFYEFAEGPAFVQQVLIAKELWPSHSAT